MTLAEIRQVFCQQSGRYDLVNNDGTDAGADYFIKAGQRYLDRLFDNENSTARTFRSLDVGQFFVKVAQLRYLEECWLVDPSGPSRTELKFAKMRQAQCYFGVPLQDITPGSPLLFALCRDRVVEETLSMAGVSALHFSDTIAGTTGQFKGVVVLPPPDSAGMHLELVGKFDSEPLDSETATSYWTENHDDILVLAALYKLECLYRNSAGAKDALNVLLDAVRALDMDMVAQETVNADQMED